MPADYRPAKGWTQIVKNLNVREEFEELGVEFTSDHPTAQGYLSCWAFDRPHGDSPSAGVNTRSGWYIDHGGMGQRGYLYQIRARMGFAPNDDEGLKYYALKTDQVRELSGELQSQAYALDSVRVFDVMPPASVHSFFERYPEISPCAVRDAGGLYAKWPAKSPDANYVIAFRVVDRQQTQTGYVLQSIPAAGILKFRGEDNPPERLNRVVLGSTGLVGELGIRVMQSPECEVILKLEGISDMLTCQSIVPEELRGRVAVLTNACGCRDVPASSLGLFRDKRVVVIHDGDVPGQEGAALWCNSLRAVTPHVKNLVLFPSLAEKKGPDLRDWLREGGTFARLLDLIRECPDFTPDQATLTPEQAAGMALGPDATEEEIQDHVLLQKLGVLVLGHLEGTNKIVCYSDRTARSFQIDSIDRYKVETALLNMGSVVDQTISMSAQHEPGKHSLTQLKRAIARKAAKKSLRPEDRMGAGVWLVGDRIVLVNDGEISIANGDITSSKVPAIGGKVIEFASDPWYEHDRVSELYEQTHSPAWCARTFDEAAGIFALWDNWKNPDTPFILASMVCASWIQTTLDFRPGMVVTGPSNSGKSLLLEECVAKMFGKMAMFVTEPSEAGIRQKMRFTSKVLLIDEFESSAHRQKILSVLRSSTRGTDIVKGTADQNGKQFHFRHIPWLGSIETGLTAAADRNRYIVLELKELPDGRGSTLRPPPAAELEEIGLRLLVVGMRHHAAIRRLHLDLKATPIPGVNRRIVEVFSLPAAVLGAVNQLDLEASRQILVDMLQLRFSAEDFEGESDESALLEAIAMVSIRTPAGEFTVSQLLGMQSYELETGHGARKVTPESVLERVGVKATRLQTGKGRVTDKGEAKGLAIAIGSFVRHLKDTRFGLMKIDEILLRLPESRKTRLRIGTKVMNCVVIPRSAIVNNEESENSSPENQPEFF